MLILQTFTPATRYRRPMPGFVCRTAPLAGFDGRSVPVAADASGGRAP
jgi:hypothetical protein